MTDKQHIEVMEPVEHDRKPVEDNTATEVQLSILQEAYETGQSIAVVAKKYNIPRSTLHGWLQQMKEEVQLQAEVRDLAIVEKLDEKINQMLQTLDKDKMDEACLKDLVVAFGIAMDKREKLIGQKKSGQTTHLRVVWKGNDGQGGAVEVETE